MPARGGGEARARPGAQEGGDFCSQASRWKGTQATEPILPEPKLYQAVSGMYLTRSRAFQGLLSYWETFHFQKPAPKASAEAAQS